MKTLDFLKEQVRATESGRKYALVTIVEANGSAPRSEGKMLVYENGETLGTIGGGKVEQLAISDAKECMRLGEKRLCQYDLSSSDAGIGMTCGGTLKVFIEVFAPSSVLVMCGAGHIGGAVLSLAKFLGFETILLDDRDKTLIEDKIALADSFFATDDFENSLLELSERQNLYVVIATHGHRKDEEALKGAMQIDAAYVGMIGSRRKIQTLFTKLEQEGIKKNQLEQVYTPIGLDLGGQSPEEIAVAIIAEILSVKYDRRGGHLATVRR